MDIAKATFIQQRLRDIFYQCCVCKENLGKPSFLLSSLAFSWNSLVLLKNGFSALRNKQELVSLEKGYNLKRWAVLKIPLQLNSEKNTMYCQRIALFVAIFGSLLSSQINGSTLPPPVDEITNKTTLASNGEF